MLRRGSPFIGVVGVLALATLAGCADFKDRLEHADRRLQGWFGTAAPPPRDPAVVESTAPPLPAVPPRRPRDPLQHALADWDAGRFERAVSRLRPLAEAGNPAAQYRLGLAYAQGRGVARNPVSALAWWHKAGIQGNPEAQYQLGEAYLEGRGVEEDAGLASAWLARAAAREHAPATYRLAMLYQARGEAVSDEAQRRSALVLLERAAEQGHPQAQDRMGEAYAEGLGVERDPLWAARWSGKAARQGVAAAQTRLGHAFASGEGVPRDPLQAAAWYRIAAAQSHAAAAEALQALEASLAKAEVDEVQALSGHLTRQAAGRYDDVPTVLYVQTALAQQGHDPGAPDGMMGPGTRGALMAWQRALGLTPDGVIGLRVLNALRGTDTMTLQALRPGDVDAQQQADTATQ